MTPTGRTMIVAATAADPRNAITYWNAMRRWFTEHGLPIEYALFSTYDGLCRALLDGAVDIAWNAPMAHAQSLMVSGGTCRTLAMRDTDQDVATVIIALTSSDITAVEDLRGRTVAVGVPTSTELHLIPRLPTPLPGIRSRYRLHARGHRAACVP